MLDFLLRTHVLPETVIRFVIRKLCKQRLIEQRKLYESNNHHQCLVDSLKDSPIALAVEEANAQHYTVPTAFYSHVLGKALKYSSALWEKPGQNLNSAETCMIDLVIKRAQLQDGQMILDLGCGWGSMSLALARKFTNSAIVAVSNSITQKQYIDAIIDKESLPNLTVICCDINHFKPNNSFDRIISIEMFEHVRNYEKLIGDIKLWLNDGGKVFVHHFCHDKYAYPFDDKDGSSWMARNFFKDGLMPSYYLLDYFIDGFKKEAEWKVNGMHYALTSNAWLANLKKNKSSIIKLFKAAGEDGHLKYEYWRVFFLACAELFAYNDGNEWYVKHLLLSKEG